MSDNATQFELVVGLGNPGPKYTETRHNAGFWFLDALAHRYNASFKHESRFSGELSKARICDKDIYLLKPSTFMNLSGQSISAVASYFKIPAQKILVVHDELDLPAGTIRIKQGGGHGGHNGLRDSIATLGKDFWRLRLGIGHPGHKDAVVGYVLKRASKEDQRLIDDAIYEGMVESENLLSLSLTKAMQALHSRRV
jgi:PTH1 family peptidyl-tRNA hydrolase